MDSDGFSDLLHQAQQLTSNMDTLTGGESLPRVERNLFQLRDAAAKLASHSTGTTESTDVKAYVQSSLCYCTSYYFLVIIIIT